MTKKTVNQVDVNGKRVLVRVDFNVPLDPETGAILDDSRIRASLPTLQLLLDRGASLGALLSHGSAQGKRWTTSSGSPPSPDASPTSSANLSKWQTP